jgi:hypothetical protein
VPDKAQTSSLLLNTPDNNTFVKEIASRNFLYYCLTTLLTVTVAGRLYYSGLLSLLLTVSILDFGSELANQVKLELNRGDLDVQEQEQLK